MKILIFLFLLGFSSSYGSEGFYKVNGSAPQLPKWSQVASQSVFRIVMRTDPAMAIKLDQDQLRESLIKCQTPQNAVEVLNCENYKKCVVGTPCSHVFQHAGTAFLVGDGSELVTAWHVVEPIHAAALILFNGMLSKRSLADRSKTLQNMRPG